MCNFARVLHVRNITAPLLSNMWGALRCHLSGFSGTYHNPSSVQVELVRLCSAMHKNSRKVSMCSRTLLNKALNGTYKSWYVEQNKFPHIYRANANALSHSHSLMHDMSAIAIAILRCYSASHRNSANICFTSLHSHACATYAYICSVPDRPAKVILWITSFLSHVYTNAVQIPYMNRQSTCNTVLAILH